jgi:23S rRNA pseudouridine1911/1915/1917 synthase
VAFDLRAVLAAEEEIRLTVPPGLDGLRVDVVLARLMPYASRTWLAALAREGRVDLPGRAATPASRVRSGEPIVVRYRKRGRDAGAPLAPLPAVLLEDESCLVLDKPSGLPVYPTSSHYRNTVLTLLHHHRPDLAGDVFLCHRLDRDTSGVLLAAKGVAAFRHLAAQFARRTVGKRYLAVVVRRPAAPAWVVAAPVGGRSATTRFALLGPAAGGWCVVAAPREGRRHQIRVHLAGAGLPVRGDRVHGGEPCERLLLHAWRLAFAHPRGERVRLESRPPSAFERIANPQSL